MLADIDFGSGVEDAWSDITTFVPKLIGFLVILLVGYFIAKAIAKVADKVLERVGFDKAVERGGVGRAMAKSKYDASDLVGKLIFYTLFLIVLQMAFGVFGTNPISDMLTSVVSYLPKVFAAVVIVVVGAAIAAAVKEIVQAAIGGLSYGKVLSNVAGFAILTVAGFAALNQLGIAKDIVNTLFIGLTALVVGSGIIAIGGGGIQPMQQRWTNVLNKYDQEKPAMQQASQGTADRLADRAQQVTGQAQTQVATSQPEATRPLRAERS